jgi:uncharacterized protein (DUF1330 family)
VLTEITDPVGMAEYRTHVLPVIERYGGRFLASGPEGVGRCTHRSAHSWRRA